MASGSNEAKAVPRNASCAVLQVLVSGASLFFVYRFLLAELGAEKLGVWSLVLATTSASKICEMGFAAGAVKFVAEALAVDDRDKASRVIQTATISVGVLFAIMLLAVTPLLLWWLERFVPEASLADAKMLLPFACGCVWISAVGGVSNSSLDGCHRADLRAWLVMASSLIYLVMVWVITPRYGLFGLGVAQIIQASCTAIMSWLTLRYQLKELPYLPFRWTKKVFREMLGYGINFQVISIANLMYEPITKTLVSEFGGLSATAFYEMANRMVLQVRSLVISANRVLVPTMAAVGAREPDKLRETYSKTYRLVFMLTVAVFSGLVAITPLVERVWVQKMGSPFAIFALMIIAANIINTLTAPAYFMNLATGHLSWNVASHLAVGVMSLVLGVLMGPYFGKFGSVGAAALGLAIGSSVTLLGHKRRGFMRWRELIPAEGIGFAIALFGWAALAFVTLPKVSANDFWGPVGLLAIGAAVAIPLVWFSPLVREFYNTFLARLRPNRLVAKS